MSTLNFKDEDKLISYIDKNINYNFKTVLVKDSISTRLEEQEEFLLDSEDLITLLEIKEDLSSIPTECFPPQDEFTLSMVIDELDCLISKLELKRK